MKIQIPKKIVEKWASDLKQAGRREIGGVLFGEQIREGEFRLLDATKQSSWGSTSATFTRHGVGARKEVLALHERYGGNPERFNYLGEWHSHPNAPVRPSLQDEFTMRKLLVDQGKAVNFLVLLIVKLDRQTQLHIGAMTYLSSGQKLQSEVVLEEQKIDHVGDQ